MFLGPKKNVEDVFKGFYMRLLKVLPMDDAFFQGRLFTANLLPGNTKNEVKAILTNADKVEFFITKVILPDLAENRTNLDRLLTVMEESDSEPVQKLAAEICQALL